MSITFADPAILLPMFMGFFHSMTCVSLVEVNLYLFCYCAFISVLLLEV